MIKIILAEDHLLIRKGITMLLGIDPSIKIVAEASNGQQVLELIKSGIEVDVILSDMSMPTMDGPTLLRQIKVLHPNLKVVFLSMIEDENEIARVFRDGALGYLLKNVEAPELIHAIKTISKGGKYVSTDIALSLLIREPLKMNIENDKEELQQVSAREIEVLQLIADGFTSIEIADKLFLSRRTVEGHRQSLMLKLHARTSGQLVKNGLRSMLI